jgi:predicted lipoprotein with Yx(FWY)xxD motif
MRRTAICLLPALAASMALAACGASSYSAGTSSKSNAAATSTSQSVSGSSGGAGAVVKTATNPTLAATVLTDADGMTLYRLSGEQSGSFICTGGCLQIWHPLAAPAAGAPNGAVASLGTVKRPEGGEQVTYKGMPLYTFASDQKPGDAKGQGLKDVGTWNAVTVAGATPAAKTPAAPAKSPPPRYGAGSPY